MTRSAKIQEQKLDQLEAEFKPLLIVCLQQCSRGKWGLFGAYDNLEPRLPYLEWPEAKRVTLFAQEIQSIHAEFGSNNWLCEEFLRLRDLSLLPGSNLPGEPRLAAELLKKIEEMDSRIV